MHGPLPLSRRQLLLAGAALGWPPAQAAAHAAAPAARTPLPPLRFPRDHGSHPGHRTEWWYVTGHAQAAGGGGRAFGFQVTFFRSRVEGTQGLTSRFAARQLVFAHAALTDVAGKTLLHDQRIARSSGDAALDQGHAAESDTAVTLRDWSLKRDAVSGRYDARVAARDFALALAFMPTQPLLLQGEAGWSRKGPDPQQASWYYSQPQLAASGRLTLRGQPFDVTGTAWLDHEWSNELLAPNAVGWDWIGMNLFDGSALTAFQLRDAQGRPVWDGGSYRHPTAGTFIARPGETQFQPGATWKSPLTQAVYPVEWTVRTPADFYTVKAVLPAQELDSRGSTGAVYWEGLSDLYDGNRRHVGRGYLEMTGYARPLQL